MQHGDIIAGRYRLDRKIGQGGTGSIWVAQDDRLDRQVAIKFLFASNPQHQERLAKRVALEAKIAASIQHRNVVQIFDFGTHADNIPFIVMEALTGHTMGEAFETNCSFSLDMLIHIMSEVLRGLATVHDAGIVHRDLKPDNIFLVRQRGDKLSPKLLDFGISRSLEPDTRRSAVTTTEGLILGTPQYMSPEQARGLGDIDKRTDIYSVGIIMFEALAGYVPFDSENMGDLLLKVIRGKAPSLSQISPQLGLALCDVVDKALARSRDHRYSDAAEMHDALTAAAALVPAAFDRNALLFPPSPIDRASRSRHSASEFPPHIDSGAAPDSSAPPGEDTGRRTRRERRRDDGKDAQGLRKPTPHSGDMTVERGASLPARSPRERVLLWALGAAAAASITGSIVFALVNRAAPSDPSGFIVVQASPGPARAAPDAAAAAGTPSSEPEKPRESPQLAAVKGVEPRTRKTPAAKSRPRAKDGADALQQRASEVASAFSRQKDGVIDCLDQHPADMEDAPQLVVRLRVDPAGHVADAVLLPESISNKPVGGCVARAVTAMTFAKQPQATTFRVPLLWRRR